MGFQAFDEVEEEVLGGILIGDDILWGQWMVKRS